MSEKIQLPFDLQELCFIFEDTSCEHRSYLDLETGEIIRIFDDIMYSDEMEELERLFIIFLKFKKETIVIDDRMIGGIIIEQIDEAMDFIRKNINVGFVMTNKMERVWDYSLRH